MVYYFTSTGKDATGLLDSLGGHKYENKRIKHKFLAISNYEITFSFQLLSLLSHFSWVRTSTKVSNLHMTLCDILELQLNCET